MRWLAPSTLIVILASATFIEAQSTRRTPATKGTSSAATTRVEAQLTCPSELGQGLRTKRRFCDVLTGRDPKEGVLVTIPPHRGPVTLSFELHNRHMYSEDLIKTNRAFRQYTATIGVLTMDNTLLERAVVRSEFRSAADLVDRIEAGAGLTGVKAVAPTGTESISIQLPEDVGTQVSLLGEVLRVTRPDGEDTFTAPGRPIATISNVTLEYRDAAVRPAPKAAAPKKTPAKKTPAKKTPPKKTPAKRR